ncbi:PPE family protein [Dirofilaria immitis]
MRRLYFVNCTVSMKTVSVNTEGIAEHSTCSQSIFLLRYVPEYEHDDIWDRKCGFVQWHLNCSVTDAYNKACFVAAEPPVGKKHIFRATLKPKKDSNNFMVALTRIILAINHVLEYKDWETSNPSFEQCKFARRYIGCGTTKSFYEACPQITKVMQNYFDILTNANNNNCYLRQQAVDNNETFSDDNSVYFDHHLFSNCTITDCALL